MREIITYQARNSTATADIDRCYYEDFTFIAHFHASPELVYVTDGEVEAVIDGAVQTIPAGAFCLVLPWQIHAYATPAHSHCVVLVLPERYISAFLRDMASYHGRTQTFIAEEPIRQLFTSHLCEGPWPDEYLLSGILLALCHSFVEQCELLPNADEKRTALLSQMLNYVSEHFREDLSLQEVADALGYSYYYLSHLFSQFSGLSFQQFRNLKRIEYSQHELCSTRRPISAIAYDSGFTCVRSFNRVFRNLLGMTPLEYRLQNNRSE